MLLLLSLVYIFFTNSAAPNLFDHATKNYTHYLNDQSLEKRKFAELIIKAANIIKEIEEQTEKKDLQDPHDVECDEKTFDEFRLICAKNGAPFLEKINPKTSVGLTHLIKLLAQPTTNTEVLTRRQAIIRFFIEHPDITAKIQALLTELQKEEAFLLNPYKNYTFINKVQTMGTFSFLSALHIFVLYSNYLFGFFEYCAKVDASIKCTLENTTRLNELSTETKSAIEHLTVKIKAFFKYENMKDLLHITRKRNPNDYRLIPLFSFGPLVFFTVYLWQIKKILFNFKDFIINNPLKTYITEIFTLSERVNNQNHFFKMIEILQEMQSDIPYRFYSLKADKSFLTKITNLNASTHSHAHYCIDIDGTLIPVSQSSFAQEKISTELHPHGDFLKKLYFDIGLLDAYTALAQFYTKFNGQFAQYVNPINPIIDIEGGLHPNISGHPQSITNNFLHTPHFGKPVTVCSGKNGSGKSFNTKTILLLAWLCQTVTFTLTEKPSVISPFDYFKIHANISDSDYYSKFETEKNELGQLLKKVAALEHNNKKGLILFDEPLSTTSSTLAEPLINTLISMLKNNRCSLAFIITHLHAILSNKDARQMSIKVTKNDDETFTSTRKFQEGPSYDNDAAQLLAQTLNPELRTLFLKNYANEVKKIQERNGSSLPKETPSDKKVIADSDKN